MKIIRLVSIIALLLRKEKVQAKDLAEMFEVSVRTILRDIDTIDQAGIPIVTTQGVGGGIGLAEGFRIDKSVLTSEEIGTIIASLNTKSFSQTELSNEVLIDKFKNILKEDQVRVIEQASKQLVIDHKPWFENNQIQLLREKIQIQIKNHLLIDFNYKPMEGAHSHRTIEPYSLVFKNHRWYVYGYCFKKEAFRLFKLQRMRDTCFSDTAFTPKDFSIDDLSFKQNWVNQGEKELFVLSFEPFMRGVIDELFSHDTDVREENGKIIVTFENTLSHMFLGYILSFGDTVEVVSPQKAREDILSLSQNIYKKYI